MRSVNFGSEPDTFDMRSILFNPYFALPFVLFAFDVHTDFMLPIDRNANDVRTINVWTNFVESKQLPNNSAAINNGPDDIESNNANAINAYTNVSEPEHTIADNSFAPDTKSIADAYNSFSYYTNANWISDESMSDSGGYRREDER